MESAQGVSSVTEQLRVMCNISQIDDSRMDIPLSEDTTTMADNPESRLAPTFQNAESVEESSKENRKLFVGPLRPETTESELRDHFGQFGKIERLSVKKGGYAFIVFASSEALSEVGACKDHAINPKDPRMRRAQIFVGGLTTDITDDDIKAHFEKFGAVTEVAIRFDEITKERKELCFVFFENAEVVKNVLRMPKHIINGREIIVGRVMPNIRLEPNHSDSYGVHAIVFGQGNKGARAGRHNQRYRPY